MHKIDVFIADDHPVVRKGLQEIIEEAKDLRLVGFATNGHDAFDKIVDLNPDVALIDIDMPVLTGMDILDKFSTSPKRVQTAFIILTMHEDVALLNKSMRLGAKSYLLKSSKPETLLEAIRKVHLGETYFIPEVLTKVMQSGSIDQTGSTKLISKDVLNDQHLTSRELDVLKWVASGLTNVQIGEKMHISPRTVDTHRTNLMKKLDVGNVASLVRIALKNGLID